MKNSRIQTMVFNCLNNRSESEDEDNENQDVYDNSHSSSPMHFSADLLSTRRKFNTIDMANHLHEKSTYKEGDGDISNNNLLAVSAEAFQCPLSPQLSLDTNLDKKMTDKTVLGSSALICDNDVETAAEKSLEPPPYSPLTPRPNIAKNTKPFGVLCAVDYSNNALLTSEWLLNHEDQFIEASAEKSVEPVNPISPLPLMSPETAKLFHVLADSMNISDHEDVPDTPIIASLRNNEVPLIDSDDSVIDPNYCAIDDCGSSDDSSNNSISLITSTVSTHAELNHDNSSIETVSAQEIEPSQTESQTLGRPRKGRKPRFGGLSREERKKRKYSNLSYVNSRKKTVQPKQFKDYKCSCLKKCHEMIPVEKRLVEFKKFYSLGSYNAQNMFLTALIKEQPVKRHYVATHNNSNVSKKKSYSRQYFLDGISLCRDMFVNTLQTSAKRINTSLCKMRSDNSIIDNRGLHGGRNRTSPESEQFVINLIKKLPVYVSHYRREKTEGAKFLRADMTHSKIYELYTDEAKAAGVKILSAAKVHKLFLTNFNLRTKPLKKDTCNKCDHYESQILHASSEQNKIDLKQKRIAHQQTAESLQKQMRIDLKLAKDDPSVETLCFDLEKTLPLPRIPTNIVFYKRQLWVYNLGIHTGSKDEAHCNLWVEGEAGRGAQEVGSCLIKHILERLDVNVKHLILWSDSCGGQNRNIKLTLMLKALLNEHPTLDQINMRFLESGHSFLPNDTDFGKIECALKRQQRLYTPDDYIQIMKNCKKTKPMIVHRMKNEEFLSSLILEKNIINRKKTIDGEKVSWLNTKEIMLKKDEMYKIYMKANLIEDFKIVDIKKNVRGRELLITKDIMKPLWPRGKPVPDAKIKDLKSLLHLIPQDSHSFYVQLVGNADVEDDIEGFSGQPDFEVELDLEI